MVCVWLAIKIGVALCFLLASFFPLRWTRQSRAAHTTTVRHERSSHVLIPSENARDGVSGGGRRRSPLNHTIDYPSCSA